MDMTDVLALLEDARLGPAYRDEDDRVAFPLWTGGRAHWVQLTLDEGGAYVRLLLSGIAALPPRHRRTQRAAVMELLLAKNSQVKLIKFGIDPNDGEIMLEVAMPLGDGALSRSAFDRAMMQIVATLRFELPNVEEACSRRWRPEPSTDEEDPVLKDLLDALEADDPNNTEANAPIPDVDEVEPAPFEVDVPEPGSAIGQSEHHEARPPSEDGTASEAGPSPQSPPTWTEEISDQPNGPAGDDDDHPDE